jgi:hypothetical protein
VSTVHVDIEICARFIFEWKKVHLWVLHNSVEKMFTFVVKKGLMYINTLCIYMHAPCMHIQEFSGRMNRKLIMVIVYEGGTRKEFRGRGRFAFCNSSFVLPNF